LKIDKQKPDTATLSYKVLTLDMKKYLGQLKDWDISEAQKQDLIKMLWAMLRPFAELGFEIHPAQLAQNACKDSTDKTVKTKSLPTVKADYVLSSKPVKHIDNEESI